MRLSGSFDFSAIARKTPGYVGADLRSLTREAAALAVDRIMAEQGGGGEGGGPEGGYDLEGLCVTMDDFLEAVKNVQPSAKREGFATVPDVGWGDIGALGTIREEVSVSALCVFQVEKNGQREGTGGGGGNPAFSTNEPLTPFFLLSVVAFGICFLLSSP